MKDQPVARASEKRGYAASRSGSRPATALVALVSIGVSIAILEVALRAVTPFPIDSPDSNTVPDPLLGQRMDPALPDVDERGFRNSISLDRAYLVALGDSHTYGYNVKSEDAWPVQLGHLLGRPVQNFGVPGYGILQYHDLMPEALALRPEHVVVAMYLANDIVSICGYRKLEHWKAKLREGPEGARIIESCAKLLGPSERPLETPPAPTGFRSRLKETAIGSAIFHLVWMPLKSELQVRGQLDKPGRYIRIDDPDNGMLISRGRLQIHGSYMDLDSPEVTALTRFAEQRLLDMQRLAESENARLWVMFVPSRERVLYAYLLERGVELPPAFHWLVEKENEMLASFRSFLDRVGIGAVDLEPFVARALAEGHVYPRREDGHPLAPGYRAYARGAYETFFRDPSTGGSE